MTEIKKLIKIDIWPTIASTLLIILIVIILFSNQSSNKYRGEIKSLEKEKEELLNKLNEYTVSIDTFRLYQDSLYDSVATINTLTEEIIKLKEENESKVYIDFSNISIDSNVVILSRNLSQDIDR
jgi:ABC-type multidrug transport system fused ATPase/permease subunit